MDINTYKCSQESLVYFFLIRWIVLMYVGMRWRKNESLALAVIVSYLVRVASGKKQYFVCRKYVQADRISPFVATYTYVS